MGISSLTNRAVHYYSRHGFVATVERLKLAAHRALFANHQIVFYCDLTKQALTPIELPKSLKVECLSCFAQLSSDDLETLTSFWNPTQARENIKARLAKGASLWLIRSEDRLAGYGWTLQGNTIAPYFFPVGKNDVQLFDFYTFPKFRGRGTHWLLNSYILHVLAAEGSVRAFGDTREWNAAQLSSFKMTPFRRLGVARTFTIFGKTFVSWTKDENRAETIKRVQDNRVFS